MQLGIDLTAVETQSGNVVVPTGTYPMEIVGVEPKETSKKTGWMLEVSYKITAGDHAGKTIKERLNVQNQSADATRIGLSQLKTILTAGKHANPNYIGDTNEMIGLKLNLYVEEVDSTFTNKNNETINTTQNNIKAYYEYNEADAQSEAKKEPPATSAPTTAAPNPFAAAPAPIPAAAPTPAPVATPQQPAQTPAATPAPTPAASPAPKAFPWG